MQYFVLSDLTKTTSNLIAFSENMKKMEKFMKHVGYFSEKKPITFDISGKKEQKSKKKIMCVTKCFFSRNKGTVLLHK